MRAAAWTGAAGIERELFRRTVFLRRTGAPTAARPSAQLGSRPGCDPKSGDRFQPAARARRRQSLFWLIVRTRCTTCRLPLYAPPRMYNKPIDSFLFTRRQPMANLHCASTRSPRSGAFRRVFYFSTHVPSARSCPGCAAMRSAAAGGDAAGAIRPITSRHSLVRRARRDPGRSGPPEGRRRLAIWPTLRRRGLIC